MNVDNENKHSSSRSLSFDSFEVIICWAPVDLVASRLRDAWIRSGVANFTRFIHHFPNIRLLQITPGWAHSSPRPQLSSLPPDPGMWWMCLGTTILSRPSPHHVSALPIVIRSQHPDCDPSPSSINATLMTSWLLLTRQNLIVLKYHLLVKHHTSTSQR